MMKTIKFMYFWLNYSDKSNHLKRISTIVINFDHLFCMANEWLASDGLHLFFFSKGTWIDNNGYLESLERAKELIVFTKELMQKDLIYFDVKRYWHFKNISYHVKSVAFYYKALEPLLSDWLLQVNYSCLQIIKTGWLFLLQLWIGLIKKARSKRFQLFTYDFELGLAFLIHRQ